MRCLLAGSTLNSYTSSSTPERPLEWPNRITRLIANRREKLMRLAALEGGVQSKNNRTVTNTSTAVATTSNAAESVSTSEPENNKISRRNKNKGSKIMQKGIKRKHNSHMSTRRNRTRRKQSNVKNESDSEPDDQESYQQSQVDNNPYIRTLKTITYQIIATF